MFTPARTVTQRLYMRVGMTERPLSSTASHCRIALVHAEWDLGSGDEDLKIPQSKHLEEAVNRAIGAAVADPDRDDPVQPVVSRCTCLENWNHAEVINAGSQKCQQRRRKRLRLFFRDKMS